MATSTLPAAVFILSLLLGLFLDNVVVGFIIITSMPTTTSVRTGASAGPLYTGRQKSHPIHLPTRPLSSSAQSSTSASGEESGVDEGDGEINNNFHDNNHVQQEPIHQPGKLEELKLKEAELLSMLASVRREKLSAIRSRPLTIGMVGFGRFGQFIAPYFAKYGKIVVTSRTDYSQVAESMGYTYIPLSQPDQFLANNLDVIVISVSILSFKSTMETLAAAIRNDLARRRKYSIADTLVRGPLVVDVLSVKEHPRRVMLDILPPECDILCTHPMFGPDSGKNGWTNLNFVYERTRVQGVILDPQARHGFGPRNTTFLDATGEMHSVHEDTESYVEGMDRMERFLSIWEEEGCRMVQMSCTEHDTYAANSQFITHLVGRVLGSQGLRHTPIDTSGFQSVLRLIDSTTADSFDLFYGLYKYNENSLDTIRQLQSAMSEVVDKLQRTEQDEQGQIEQVSANVLRTEHAPVARSKL